MPIEISDLTDKQEEAVKTKGPLTIFAGAGSGKTTILEKRYEYLVNEKDVDPYNILVTTFTRSAANEIESRLDISGNVGTIHGEFFKIVKENSDKFGFSKNITPITTESDKKDIVRSVLVDQMNERTDLNQELLDDTTEIFANKIDEVRKNFKVDELKELCESGEIEFETLIRGEKKQMVRNASDLFYKVYNEYMEELRNQDLIDFTGMLFFALKVMRDNSDVLEKYEARFEHLMIDEAQDLNSLQYELIRLLSNKDKDVCLIGDDCQNIYSWRGADHKLINKFEHEFDAERIVVEINFRSSKQILSIANYVNSQLRDGVVNKKLESNKGMLSSSVGHPKVFSFDSYYDENRFISKKIDYLLEKEDYSPEEIAVISKRSKGLKSIYNNLVRKNIPVYNDRGKQLLERKEVQYVLDFVKMYYNRDSEQITSKVLDKYVVGIGEKTLKDMKSKSGDKTLFEFAKDLDEKNDIKGLGPKYWSHLQSFTSFIENLDSHEDPVGIIVEDNKDWKTDIESFCTNYNAESKFNVELIAENIYKYSFNFSGIQKFFDKVINTLDESDENNSVRLTTIHGSKGMEWKVVFIPRLVEGVFPNKYALDKGNLEEQKRLFYVALTRPKEKSWITWHREDYKNDIKEPSAFLNLIKSYKGEKND